jgi:hypothetical protein
VEELRQPDDFGFHTSRHRSSPAEAGQGEHPRRARQVRRPGAGTQQLPAEQLGVAILFPNVRGSIGFGKKFMSLDDDAYAATRSRTSARCSTGFLEADLDKSRVVLVGISSGGWLRSGRRGGQRSHPRRHRAPA